MPPVKDSIDRLIDSTYDFGRIMRQQMLGQISKGKQVNFLQLHALFLISEQEGLTMKELAKLLHVSSPSATSLVNRLVRTDWVHREHDETNRKLVRLRLTPAGKKVLREKHEQRRQILREVFSFLSKAEQEQLARIHEKLGKSFHSHSSP